MKKYPEYKDSGIEWLGEIPKHWQIIRAYSVFNLKKNLIRKTDINGSQVLHYSIPSVQETGTGVVEDGETIDSDKFIISGDEILFSKMNPRKETICLTNKDKLLSVASTEFLVLDAISINTKYGFYLLKSHVFKERVSSTVQSATKSHQRANPNDIYKLWIQLPTDEEQTAIANFLDHKTQQIDDLIERKKRLIELLKEERTAVINQAVTKGLDPMVPMKDSGIEWLGEIPEHWEVSKMKYVTISIIDTEHKTVTFYDDGHYYVVRTSDVRNGILLTNQMKRTDETGYTEWTRRAVPKHGDVLLSREAPAGEACVIPENTNVCLGQRMVLLKVDIEKVLPAYLVMIIYSEVVEKFISNLSQGSTVAHLNMEDIKNIPIIIPSTIEQQQILNTVVVNKNIIETTIDKAEAEVDLLSEYKTSLINEAVTGKIDVRDYQISHATE